MSGGAAARLQRLAAQSAVTIYVVREPVRDGAPGSTAYSEGGAAALPAAAAVELAQDCERAMRYLALDGWDSVLVECSRGTLCMMRSANGDLAMVSAPAGAPAGAVQRLATRVTESLGGS